MSRKFSIYSTILLEEILKEIDEYIMATGETNPYLFMSANTMRTIRDSNAWLLKATTTSNHKASDGTLCGYKVFINDDLRFGTVEIR